MRRTLFPSFATIHEPFGLLQRECHVLTQNVNYPSISLNDRLCCPRFDPRREIDWRVVAPRRFCLSVHSVLNHEPSSVPSATHNDLRRSDLEVYNLWHTMTLKNRSRIFRIYLVLRPPLTLHINTSSVWIISSFPSSGCRLPISLLHITKHPLCNHSLCAYRRVERSHCDVVELVGA